MTMSVSRPVRAAAIAILLLFGAALATWQPITAASPARSQEAVASLRNALIPVLLNGAIAS